MYKKDVSVLLYPSLGAVLPPVSLCGLWVFGRFARPCRCGLPSFFCLGFFSWFLFLFLVLLLSLVLRLLFLLWRGVLCLARSLSRLLAVLPLCVVLVVCLRSLPLLVACGLLWSLPVVLACLLCLASVLAGVLLLVLVRSGLMLLALCLLLLPSLLRIASLRCFLLAVILLLFRLLALTLLPLAWLLRGVFLCLRSRLGCPASFWGWGSRFFF
jgi:hypothetical protein